MARAKTGLLSEKRNLRERGRANGMSYREIALEFSRAYGLRPRAAWREAYGWTLVEEAARINAFRGEIGIDPRGISGMTSAHLSEYENWPGQGDKPTGRRPSPYLLATLAKIYGCNVLQLVDVADRRHMPAAELLVLQTYNDNGSHPQESAEHGDSVIERTPVQSLKQPEIIEPCQPAPDSRTLDNALQDQDHVSARDVADRVIPTAKPEGGEEEIEMERRNLLQSLGVLGIASAPAIGALDHIRRSLGSAFDQSDRDHLDDWENAVAEYGYSYLAMSPATLISDLAADMVAIRSIVASLPKDSAAHRGWCRVGGAISCLMAKSFSNLGNARESRQWWNMAEHLSDSSGDIELSLWVRGERIVHGLYERRPAQALLNQVKSATEFAHGHTGCPGFAHVTTARAQALVMAGDHDGAERELQRAADVFAQLPSSATQDTSSVMDWGQDRLHYTETWVYSHTGNKAKAAQAAEHALILYPSSDGRTPTQIKLMLAFSLIRSGDVSEGLQEASKVYSGVTPEQRTNMVDTLARQVIQSIPAQAQNTPDAMEYRALVTSSSSKAIEA